jgi:NRAMP (natural resistance-associated macrophage protein)-like metal ion transporter
MSNIYLFIKNKFKKLGPGFITGAADDDPSGIATYSIAGAQFGYKLNWLSLFLIPMMVSIQEMCGRIGICSGMGLAGVIRKYYSKKILYFSVSLLLVANITNIGADLGVMAASLKMILGFEFYFWLILITFISIILEIFVSYHKYSYFLKWMGLTLLVYFVTAVITKQNWVSIINFTLIPHIDFTVVYLMTLVGFIGTTISPYLFFWQTSEEVEEEIDKGKTKDFSKPNHFNLSDIKIMQKDTIIGMVFSNIISACIVITTAATLHAANITDIETPNQAALALKPIAGNFAYILFTVGIIGIGLQSIPVLAGGVAYAISETFGFKEGLSKKFNKAKIFYLIIGLSTLIGALMNIIGINPMKALYYSAILNGVISIPLIAIIIKLADDKRVVGEYKTSKSHRITAWITLIFVSLATILMLYNIIFSKK